MDYNINIIRSQINNEAVRLRGEGMPPERLKKIKKGLLTLHTLETMATNVYKYQITERKNELNRSLIAAMLNEMTHIQDFQVKLYEYGWKPSWQRWFYGFVGFVFGTFSRIRGEKAILQTGIWVETKAVQHYGELIRDIEWDDDTMEILKKSQADEGEHIRHWKNLLKATSQG